MVVSSGFGFRHCEERSDEAIHLFAATMDCFADARNDGAGTKP
jgi:hypothetical protein